MLGLSLQGLLPNHRQKDKSTCHLSHNKTGTVDVRKRWSSGKNASISGSLKKVSYYLSDKLFFLFSNLEDHCFTMLC